MSRKKSKRYLKKISKKAGLPPGSLVHIGEEKGEKSKIEAIYYDEESCEFKEITAFEEVNPFLQRKGVTWINVDGVSDVSTVER
ncbi:MAG: magnesium and cobalt transport protein CorA, partial [Acidobacteria bacterium]|nr:magnesium and cobalt transport protein CorA [Acidobacteriota bacterium]